MNPPPKSYACAVGSPGVAAELAALLERRSNTTLYSATDPHSGAFIWVGTERNARDNLDALSERDYRALFLGDAGCELLGGLSDNVFQADFEVRAGIVMLEEITSQFETFIRNNPFETFHRVSRKFVAGGLARYQTKLRLGSSEYRDICHELAQFALRSGEDVANGVYTEVFDEGARIRTYGALTGHRGKLASAAIVFTDPATKQSACVSKAGFRWNA